MKRFKNILKNVINVIFYIIYVVMYTPLLLIEIKFIKVYDNSIIYFLKLKNEANYIDININIINFIIDKLIWLIVYVIEWFICIVILLIYIKLIDNIFDLFNRLRIKFKSIKKHS